MERASDNGRRAVIFAGGRLGPWALEELRPDDYLIGADSGADFLLVHGRVLDLAVGDFDSVPPDRLSRIRDAARETIAVDAVDKDWTDTELALREALDRGFADIRIAGGLGSRFDHSLANVHLLRQAKERGAQAVLADEYNEIRLCDGKCRLEADPRYPYVSLLPLTVIVTGVTLDGFRYPLHEATLQLGWSIGISNVLEAGTGSISLSDGLLLVIRSRD
ncbi:thiamine diphosphokinase [Cohnella caldifontis]|uniref:thiamine diphosphokinase n=1 Tax=Cohnella caldifontis TaxID=3027471 RepID=UPI0023EB0358|nr:thiamine diphosphokinase [Cohnella sp. YIM B05605]